MRTEPNIKRFYALIENLFIEYQGDDALLSRTGDDDSISVGEDEAAAIVQGCKEEFDRINQQLARCEDEITAATFPKLRTISICSIYGRQSDRWARYNRWCRTQEPRAARHTVPSGRHDESGEYYTSPNVARFFNLNYCTCFLETSLVTHYCTRSNEGPLALRAVEDRYGGQTSQIQETCHFGPALSEPLSTSRTGLPSRWTLDAQPGSAWQPIIVKVLQMVLDLSAQIWNRDNLQFDIYCSTSNIGPVCGPSVNTQQNILYDIAAEVEGALSSDVTANVLSIDIQRQIVERLNTAFRSRQGRHVNGEVKHTMRLHVSADTPIYMRSLW